MWQVPVQSGLPGPARGRLGAPGWQGLVGPGLVPARLDRARFWDSMVVGPGSLDPTVGPLGRWGQFLRGWLGFRGVPELVLGAVVSGAGSGRANRGDRTRGRWHWPAGCGEDGFQGCWLRGPRRPRADLLVGRVGFRGTMVGVPELLLMLAGP